MVDSGASSNVMPWSVCQKLNAKVEPSSLKIIQLDRTNVKVMGELRNVLITLSSNPKVHQFIDIIVVDIPEVYGMFLSRDWSEQLHGYFATDWSHLWLPENGKPNKIMVNRERYLKFTVKDLNDPNEPTPTSEISRLKFQLSTILNNSPRSKHLHNQQLLSKSPVSLIRIKFGLYTSMVPSPKKELVQAASSLIRQVIKHCWLVD
jgi:hypothetical protein